MMPQRLTQGSDCVIAFSLGGCQPGDIHAEAQMLRLGRRLAVMDVRIWTEAPDRLAAQANVTYVLPQP